LATGLTATGCFEEPLRHGMNDENRLLGARAWAAVFFIAGDRMAAAVGPLS